MERSEIIKLLKQRPGYEVVYLLLLQSDSRRRELAEYTGTDGGTLQRWLDRAESEGLVRRNTFLRGDDDEKVVEYSLACTIHTELIPIIEARGGNGPRDTHDGFADTAGVHHWSDQDEL